MMFNVYNDSKKLMMKVTLHCPILSMEQTPDYYEL